MPGLDGLRAVAVLVVIAFHLGIGWTPGGLLGVGIFFTLSGYLITDLLLAQWATLGRIRLGDFWLRRARRLLPALFVMLAVVTAWVTLAAPSELPELRGALAAAVGYVSNWWMIGEEISYFDRFGPPSPLGHLWSLAIEEQFYILWPFLLLGGLKFVRERDHPFPIRPRLAAITLGLALASIVAMAVLYEPGFDATRGYVGTDTRAFGLLIGAALAMVWPSRKLTGQITAGARNLLDAVGVIGLVAIALLVWRTDQYASFLYPTGLVLLSVATAAVVATVAHPKTRVGRALGWGPLRWIGVRSYGIYLWHFPIIVLTTPGLSAGLDPAAGGEVNLLRATLQVGATIVIAALSWRFVEEPIRRGALGRLWKRARERNWRLDALPRRLWPAATGAALVLVLAIVGVVGLALPTRFGFLVASSEAVTVEQQPRATQRARAVSTAPIRIPSGIAASRLRTSCRSVVHIGDSTSVGLISDDYLPNRSDQIPAQYRRVGVRDPRMEITGATSIVETLPGGINAYEASRELVRNGYRGCWVIALGTNDTADVVVGSSVDLPERIERMMSVIRNQPVLWVTAQSLVGRGPYAAQNMERWNEALLQACRRYPNMRVFDWASVSRRDWFIDDGIHYTTPGYRARGRLIADALAAAFPARRPAQRRANCLVVGSPEPAAAGPGGPAPAGR